jgi:leucyl/phenylalanyl-tRNA---protein transferase
VQLIDCQVHNPHLESLGARMIPRKQFIRYLNQA